jgi:hypothetical protein
MGEVIFDEPKLGGMLSKLMATTRQADLWLLAWAASKSGLAETCRNLEIRALEIRGQTTVIPLAPYIRRLQAGVSLTAANSP